MHPITSLFLATDHIADLHRDADLRRLASTVSRRGRPTVTPQPARSLPAARGTGAG